MYKIASLTLLLIVQCIANRGGKGGSGTQGYEISLTPGSLEKSEWINQGSLGTAGDIKTFPGGIAKFDEIPSLCFDKSGALTYINYNTNSAVRPKLSMEIWIKPQAQPSGKDWLLGHDNGGYDRSIIVYDDRYNGIAMGVGESYQSTVSYPELFEWTHIIATFDSTTSTATVYKNGGVANGGEQQTKQIVADSGGEPNIGLNGLKNYGDHNFVGCIAQVQIVDDVISSSEIKKLYKKFSKAVRKANKKKSEGTVLAAYTCDSLQADKWVNKGALPGIDITSITGSITPNVAGTGIGGVCFTPSDAITYINVNTNAYLNPQLSMEIWIYPTVTPSGKDWLLGHDNGAFDRSIIVYDDRYNGVAAGVGAPYASTISYPKQNEWTQIIVTFDGIDTNKATIYKNTVGAGGEQVSQTVDIVGVSGGEVNIGLNGLKNYADHTFGGCVGQIHIASGIASPKVVKYLYKKFKESVLKKSCSAPDYDTFSLAEIDDEIDDEDDEDMMYDAGFFNGFDYTLYSDKQWIIILISLTLFIIGGLIVNRVYMQKGKDVNQFEQDENSPLLIKMQTNH